MIKKVILVLFFLILWIYNFSLCKWDLLDDVFSDAKENNYVVGSGFIKGNDSPNIEGIITNTISFISKLAVALGVTLFLWWWVRFLVSVGEESKMKKARDDLILVWIGLFIVLGSLAILYLIQSIPKWIWT